MVISRQGVGLARKPSRNTCLRFRLTAEIAAAHSCLAMTRCVFVFVCHYEERSDVVISRQGVGLARKPSRNTCLRFRLTAEIATARSCLAMTDEKHFMTTLMAKCVSAPCGRRVASCVDGRRRALLSMMTGGGFFGGKGKQIVFSDIFFQKHGENAFHLLENIVEYKIAVNCPIAPFRGC